MRQITDAEMAMYRAKMRHLQEAGRYCLAQRRKRAWKVARLAAVLLREQFGVSRVVLFGSLVHENRFTSWSDVDIAAWGILPNDTFKAVGALIGLDDGIQVNLVDAAACRQAVLSSIEHDGVEL